MKKFTLTLERNSKLVKDPSEGSFIMFTPPVGAADYWLLRVKVSANQAIIAFPKFSTIGIGFAKEKDWNTNLPWACSTEKIFNHIKHNKGRGNISDARCIEAIKMIQYAIFELKLDGNSKFNPFTNPIVI